MNMEQHCLNRDAGALPSRRAFLEGVGTTTFLLAFQLPISGARAKESPARPGQFNAFLAIGEDDIVTVIRFSQVIESTARQGLPGNGHRPA